MRLIAKVIRISRAKFHCNRYVTDVVVTLLLLQFIIIYSHMLNNNNNIYYTVFL